jgi:hypothetical protein
MNEIWACSADDSRTLGGCDAMLRYRLVTYRRRVSILDTVGRAPVTHRNNGLEKTTVTYSTHSLPFVKPESSLSRTQEPTTESSPEPAESHPRPYTSSPTSPQLCLFRLFIFHPLLCVVFVTNIP